MAARLQRETTPASCITSTGMPAQNAATLSSRFRSRNSSIYYIKKNFPSILDVIKFVIKKSSALWISRCEQRRIDGLFSYGKSYVNWSVISTLYGFRFFAYDFSLSIYRFQFSEGILREFFGGDIMDPLFFRNLIFSCLMSKNIYFNQGIQLW